MTTKTKNLTSAYAALHEVTSTLVMISTEIVGDTEAVISFVGQNADEQSIRSAMVTAEVMIGLDYHTSTAIKAEGGWKSVKMTDGSWVLVKDSINGLGRQIAGKFCTVNFESTMRRHATEGQVTFLHNGQKVEWSAVKAEIVAIEAAAAEIF